MVRIDSKILRDYSLKKTQGRSLILRLFINHATALSYSEIERELAPNLDRVTVYRTIKTFLEKGVIHKVLDDGGSLKYALCNDSCSMKEHHHEHIHFKCDSCGQTFCIVNISVPSVSLPQGYRTRETNFLVQGKCNQCK
jgi:Fur family ferric uptake transcriptional regulator